MMFDYQSLTVIANLRREDLLREAEADALAAQIPAHPSAQRARLARWLHALANRLEPSVQPPIEVFAR